MDRNDDDANDIYTYHSFLRAVSKFPAFCGESNGPMGYDDVDTCKREIAALFAHMSETSNGLSVLEDPDCVYSLDDACKYSAKGPMGLMGEAEYESFSEDFYEGYDRGQDLLDHPERVSEDAYVGFSSAIWKYMRHALNGPSPHDIMTGFFVPNGSDIGAGHKAGFGTTTLAIDKSICAGTSESQSSKNRQQFFNEYLIELGLKREASNLKCTGMWSEFAWAGSARN